MLKRIEDLSRRATEIGKRRNRFVHDSWWTEGGDHAGQFKSYSAKEGKFGIHDVTDATETIELISKKAFEVGTLRNDIQKLLRDQP